MTRPLCFGRFMLPRGDASDWPVIACDQYTSRPEYWEAEDRRIGCAPSSLRLICPEAFLGEAEARLEGISRASREYAESALKEYRGGVAVTRTLPGGVKRRGLVCLADLECYSTSGEPLIRATEGTVTERIPPRLAVRRSSVLDVSHVICLIDDPDRTVIEPLFGEGEELYDVALPDGGRLEGRLISDTAKASAALDALMAGAEKSVVMFDLDGEGARDIRLIPLREGMRLVRLQAAGVEAAEELLKGYADCYIELTVYLTEPLTTAQVKSLKDANAGLVSIIPEIGGESTSFLAEVRKERSPAELFSEFYKSRFGEEPSDELRELFLSVTEEAHET